MGIKPKPAGPAQEGQLYCYIHRDDGRRCHHDADRPGNLQRIEGVNDALEELREPMLIERLGGIENELLRIAGGVCIDAEQISRVLREDRRSVGLRP